MVADPRSTFRPATAELAQLLDGLATCVLWLDAEGAILHLNEPAEDLLGMDGMDRQLAFRLASRGIVTMEDLAEQAVEDLLGIEDLDEQRAAALIMTARAPWFEALEQGGDAR